MSDIGKLQKHKKSKKKKKSHSYEKNRNREKDESCRYSPKNQEVESNLTSNLDSYEKRRRSSPTSSSSIKDTNNSGRTGFKEDNNVDYLSREVEYFKRNETAREKYKKEDHRKEVLKKNRLSSSTIKHDLERHNVKDWDFRKYHRFLDKIFFSSRSCIKKDTEQYRDFWLFLDKYVKFQEKMEDGLKLNECAKDTVSQNLKISPQYCKGFKINILLKNRDFDDFIGKLDLSENSEQKTHKAIALEFKDIFLHYLDFCQKQKFNKLKKLKNDQKNLPMSQYKEIIIDHVKAHQVVLVAGDTGCGKSTQLPQYLLEAGFKNIACTQPRRIACISLSKRVSFETLNEYGSEVAYQIRFAKTKTRNTRILFLTEGLLLRQLSADIYLHQYDVIVLDEVHERHVHTDFLLGVLKCLLKQREDLKLVLMSATINIDLFSSYFDNAPVVKVPGRLYPIQLEYRPISKDVSNDPSSKIDPSPYLQIMQTIDYKYPSTDRGDLLIFLSGMTEILTVVEAAHQYAQKTKKWIILPLHSALSIDQQDKVFDIAPEGVRKCIVSTNIAETSVTIDGVRFIIDSGKVKEMNFDPKLKMQCLREFWISRASAEQRKGRAGRTGPGVCFRLYSEADYDSLEDYSTPEIQRVSLNSIILQMTALGLPDCRRFPFIEKPGGSALEDSIFYLKEQGALNNSESLTAIGEMLSKLPVDVIIGKMLIMGTIFHVIDPIISMAAALSVQSPFVNRSYRDFDVENLQKPLISDHGDPFTLLNCFDEWIQEKSTRQDTRRWCKKRGLLEQRFYEMSKLKRQYKDLLQDHGLLTKYDIGEKSFQTSEERRQFNSDRKRLRHLRREENKRSKMRKILKFKEEDFAMREESDDEEDENNEDLDLKDLEFRMEHDLKQLQEVSIRSQNYTLHQINLLKIILCSGLYPQVAISDDCNSFKPNSEQVFHTKSKGFLLLHPTSVFFSQPDLLKLPDNDTNMIDHHKGIMSSKHELLAYVSILETNKPYLINTMRVPAMETLLLFCNTMDTNENCTRILCDSWLELTFHKAEEAQQVLVSAIRLRLIWQNLITSKLKENIHQSKGNPQTQQDRKLERDLAKKLAEFINSKVVYSIRRILIAELKRIYVGSFMEEPNQSINNQQHPTKGGIIVNDFLTYNCLKNDYSSTNVEKNEYGEEEEEESPSTQKLWTCSNCDLSLVVNLLEKLQHEVICKSSTQISGLVEEKKESQPGHCHPFFCTDCQKEFHFSKTEIFKHKRTHTSK